MSDYDPRPFIEANRWTFAKSVPDQPHWYLFRDKATDGEEHRRMADWLLETGRVEYKFGRPWRYRTVDGYDYWTSRHGGAVAINRRESTLPVEDPPRWEL